MLLTLASRRLAWVDSCSLHLGLNVNISIHRIRVLAWRADQVLSLVCAALQLLRFTSDLVDIVLANLRLVLHNLDRVLLLRRVYGFSGIGTWTYRGRHRSYPRRPKSPASSGSSSMYASMVHTLRSRVMLMILPVFLLMILEMSSPVASS